MKEEMKDAISGSTGECAWRLAGSPGNYTLLVSGDGAMADYDDEAGSPWREYRGEITALVIEYGVTAIGDWAFYDCRALTSAEIPDSALAIGEVAFYGCRALPSVVIPDTVGYIGAWAFACCRKLARAHLTGPQAMISNGTFANCDSLTSVVILSDSVTRIGEDAFWGCSSLTSAILPGSLVEIGAKAFCGCSSLTSAILPGSLVEIGDEVFASCDSLTSVTNRSATPQDISEGTFDDTRTATLRVPSSAVEAYKNAEGWKDFGTIIGM